jgi:hypothetical protein
MFSLYGIVLILACTPTALLDFAIPKWKADKAVRIEDTYKWLYQATRGGEHAAPDREGAKQWLDSEWSSLGEGDKTEKLIDPLCPGGEIVRINLRKFKASGGTEDDILDAFLASAAEYRSTLNEFTAVWFELGKRLKKKGFGQVTASAWERLDTEMRANNYPAVHHSDDYNKLRKPAYRIVTKSEADKLLAKLKQR